jgi:hypothetical protein
MRNSNLFLASEELNIEDIDFGFNKESSDMVFNERDIKWKGVNITFNSLIEDICDIQFIKVHEDYSIIKINLQSDNIYNSEIIDSIKSISIRNKIYSVIKYKVDINGNIKFKLRIENV